MTSTTTETLVQRARAYMARPGIRGAMWTLGGYGVAQILRLGSNLILTRLLFPAVFGQMALVGIFLQGLVMFSDVGTGPAIVQSVHGNNPAFLRTAWTIQCFRGIALWLCSIVIAIPVASFYEQPVLRWLIPAAGLNAVLGGFESTSMHTMQRELRLGMLTLLELVCQVASIVATVVLVLADRAVLGKDHPTAVWAIVGGGLAGGVLRLVLSHTLLPGIKHRFQFERGHVAGLMRFGRWIFVSTMLTFLAGQSDRLVFGKLIPLDLLGIYGIAVALAALPTQAVQRLGSAVVFPVYSRARSRPDFRDVFTRNRVPFLLGGGAIVSGFLACGPVLIEVLYDRRYWSAGPILQYLAVMSWFQILECTNGAALLAQGRVKWVAGGSAVKFAVMMILVPLGFRYGGFFGALTAVVLSEAFKYLVSGAAMAVQRFPVFVRDTVVGGGILIVSFLGSRIAAALLESGFNGVLVLGLTTAVVLVLWGGVSVSVMWRGGVILRSRAAPTTPE